MVTVEKAEKPSLRIGNENPVYAGLHHSPDQRLELLVGTDRRRTRAHNILDGPSGVKTLLPFPFAIEHAEDDARFVNRDAEAVTLFLKFIQYFLQRPSKVATGDVFVHDVSRVGDVRRPTLAGEPGGRPVRLPRYVVIDVFKTKMVEPQRGSGAHVSEVIVAVDDDRFGPVEFLRRPGIEFP